VAHGRGRGRGPAAAQSSCREPPAAATVASMTVIRHITLDANNPYGLGKFWEAVLDWPMDPECAPGDGEVLLEGPEGLPGLLLIEVPEPKTAKSRMHFDLMPQTTRDEELARVLGLGAKVVEDHRKADGAGWVWCEDPEGNAFCVERSPAERE
jgi:predicted enzyme related to lactoylglutathione lyase